MSAKRLGSTVIHGVVAGITNLIGLAVMLVVGFGLHEATEGFGIVAPLAGEVDGRAASPTWAFLSLLQVITQLMGVAARARRTDLLSYGLLVGVPARFLADATGTAAGV